MADGEILQRFTPPAIRVIQYAKEEARASGANTVGTEHVLLGLLREEGGVAARVLRRSGVDLQRTREEVARRAAAEGRSDRGSRGWSAQARRALELTLDEARELNPRLGLPNFVDTEHLLLGLLRLPDSVAFSVLGALGVDPGQCREEVVRLLGGTPPPAPRSSGMRPAARAAGLTDVKTCFGYDPRTGRTTTLATIKAAGEKWGVIRAYTCSLNAVIFDVVSGNEETLAQCSSDPFFRPAAVLSPFRRGALATPSSVKDRCFAFARIFPDQHGFAIDGLAARELLTACGEAELPVMVSVLAASPAALPRSLDRLKCTLILTGVRYHTLGEVLALAGRVPNLYLDIGGVATPDGISLVAEAFGTDHLLFGSEYPSLEVGVTATLLRGSGLSEEDQWWVRAGTAERLLEAGR